MSSSRSILLVKNLPWSIDRKDLMDHFWKFGKVVSLKLDYNPETGFPKGYAFVEFEKQDSFKKALEHSSHIVDNAKVLVSTYTNMNTEDDLSMRKNTRY